jgi:diaminopimelate epimerase
VATRIEFTKMHGAGNDFIVIDATAGAVDLTAAQWRWLADRHRGVGADQILIVEAAERDDPDDVDFVYRIVNSDGSEVEQCGNGARCFVRFVRDQGLTTKDRIRVRTRSGIIEPAVEADGRVTVDMGRPRFDPADLPFDTAGLASRREGSSQLWLLDLAGVRGVPGPWLDTVSIGNPHAVQIVADVDAAPVETEGPAIERHRRFRDRVNAGYCQIVARNEIRLRVYERGAGETLSCGTGACAAVASGIHRGGLDSNVHVQTRGGRLTIFWNGDLDSPVAMTGPAETVFRASIWVPDPPVR